MPLKSGPNATQQINSTAGRSKRKAEAASAGSSRNRKRQRESPPVQNTAPTKRLDVYVFGTNANWAWLSAESVGVVHPAAGGIYSAALTHDNQILTWGINDEKVLGRDTKQDPETSDSEDIQALEEATPLPVPSSAFPRGTIFTQLAATDSATFALTSDGSVYGWGTFNSRIVVGEWDSSLGCGRILNMKGLQQTPMLIPGLDRVIKLSAGVQHMLALTSKGTVFTWGCDEQHELGRRLGHRYATHNLIPGECALPSGIIDIGTGHYHSIAIHRSGTVYSWGSNNYGQTGIFKGAGQTNAVVAYPTKVQSLRGYSKIISMQGGKDHSLALTKDGECLSWGGIENKATGVDIKDIPASSTIFDPYGRPRILKIPTILRGVDKPIVSLGIGTDHSFAITEDGRAYSWGFNTHGAAEQGGKDEDEEVPVPTLPSSKAVDGKKLLLAVAGGQFGIVAGCQAG